MNKKLLRISGIIILVMFIFGSVLWMAERPLEYEKDEMDEVTWFCDVTFWKAPVWKLETNTIMGKISKKTGLVLDFEIPGEDLGQKLQMMLINNEIPDIVSLTDDTMMHQLVDSGKVWRIDEFLNTYDPGSELLEEFPEDTKEVIEERDGGWYALPSHLNSPGSQMIYQPCDEYYQDLFFYQGNFGAIFNAGIMEQFGIKKEELLTEEQVLAALEKIKISGEKVSGEEVIPILIDGTFYQTTTIAALEDFFGAVPINEDGNYQDIMLADETEHALAFLNLLVRKGYLSIEQFDWDTEDVKAAVHSNRVFCFIGNTANCGMNGFEWISNGPILSSEGTDPVIPKNLQATGGWINTYISKDCKEPEKIAKWLSYMTSTEGRLLTSYGVEGEDYKLDEEGRIVRTKKGEADSANYQETGLDAWWPFGNTAWVRSVAAPPAEDSAEYKEIALQCALAKYPKTQIYEEALVEFPKDALDNYPELKKAQEEIEAYKKEAIIRIVLSKDEASYQKEYAEFIGNLGKLKIEELDEIYNKFYKENCEKYNTSISRSATP